MGRFQNLVIEPLNSEHNRPGFQCGIKSLDDYLKKQAKQDVKRRISRVFIAIEPQRPTFVVAYYTLGSVSIDLNQLPEEQLKKLPKTPIPAALLGRLAVNLKAQHCGVGKMLLVDAIKRTLAVSQEIAIYAMVVDAINDDADSFYRQFAFASLGAAGRRLFLPLRSF